MNASLAARGTRVSTFHSEREDFGALIFHTESILAFRLKFGSYINPWKFPFFPFRSGKK